MTRKQWIIVATLFWAIVLPLGYVAAYKQLGGAAEESSSDAEHNELEDAIGTLSCGAYGWTKMEKYPTTNGKGADFEDEKVPSAD